MDCGFRAMALGFGFGAFELHGRCRKDGNLIETLVTGTKILNLDARKNGHPTVDDRNPALPIISTIPCSPEFRVLKVMQDFYHQP